MFSGPGERRYSERNKVLLVVWDGFKGMNFAERYLWVMQRRKGDQDVLVIAVTKEEYEKLKHRIERLI